MEKDNVKKFLDNKIESIESFKKSLDAAVAEEAKAAGTSEDDEKKEPTYYLSKAISDNCIMILQSESTINALTDLVNGLGAKEEIITPFVNLLAVCMVNSAYGSITLYDELLKAELQAQFDHMGEAINNLIGESVAYKGAIEVLKGRINELQKKIDSK